MLAILGFAPSQSRAFPLDTLELDLMTSGWSRPRADQSVGGQPLTLGGKRFEHGIGTHARSRLDLRLDRATAFDATVGVDDETTGKGSVKFLVAVDGTVRWRSGPMHGGELPKSLHVDLTGATTLSLRVEDAGDGNSDDHADWANATISTTGSDPVPFGDVRPVRIQTAHAALKLVVDREGHLWERSFGAKTADGEDCVAFPTAGDGWTFEPALEAVHADGNTSTDLRVVGVSTKGDTTRIALKDPQYPFFVDLLFRTIPEDDVIETWTEIRQWERGAVRLEGFASSAPSFGDGDLWLTQFHGDWGSEMQIEETRLPHGLTAIDSKLGTRATMHHSPMFLLSRGGPAQEDAGELFGGSLAWPGNFRFAFERLPTGELRATCGINPAGSTYSPKSGETFRTPKMAWAWSDHGTGDLSRKLHRYVRTNVLRDGDRPRRTVLNNWEATGTAFDERRLAALMDGAKALGLETFLLDDGWFGTKYPRDNDSQGLGDWIADPKKLPNGLAGLTQTAQSRGLRFGLWLEPEMVNPRSELFERHPDWAIQQPKRKLDLSRNQLVLDLSNPAVEAYVYESIDRVLRQNPGISYVKWDCNRFVTQPGSTYLPKDRQEELAVRYAQALDRILGRLAKAHPKVELMMCASGGGRVDYGAMRHAHEFWPSDNTDPARRISIQWGYSYFYPAMALADHVTLAGGHGLKFAFDVAMSGRLGMDIDVDKLSSADRAFARQAIDTYKSIRDVVQLGDLYRLESPYAGPRSSLMLVKGDRAVAFVYALGDAPSAPLRLKGLDSAKRYRIREIDLKKGTQGLDTTMAGAALMGDGLPLPAYRFGGSGVFAITSVTG